MNEPRHNKAAAFFKKPFKNTKIPLSEDHFVNKKDVLSGFLYQFLFPL